MFLFLPGSSLELMPSIMGAFDAIIGGGTQKERSCEGTVDQIRTSTPKRSHQVGNFANLSPCVQKILSNVPEQEISKKFSSEEVLSTNTVRRSMYRSTYRSFRSPEKQSPLNRSNESLDIISSNVQKMLSNLPDAELVISASQLNLSKNSSYLHASRSEFLHRVLEQQSETDGESCVGSGGGGKRVYHSDGVRDGGEVTAADGRGEGEQCQCYGQRPLGSYLHSSHGIASRTPQGRKNAGKFLQVGTSLNRYTSYIWSTSRLNIKASATYHLYKRHFVIRAAKSIVLSQNCISYARSVGIGQQGIFSYSCSKCHIWSTLRLNIRASPTYHLYKRHFK
nr:unnamed protein product [Callosobruchus analis]